MKKVIYNLIDYDQVECDDIFDHDYCNAPVLSCIIYYVTGFLCRKLGKKYNSCEICKSVFATQPAKATIPQALLVNIKSKGKLIHPSTILYNLFVETEKYFQEAIASGDCFIYDMIIDNLLRNYKFHFPCNTHKEDVIADCIYYYISMRMRQYVNIQNMNIVKQNRKKKLAILVST